MPVFKIVHGKIDTFQEQSCVCEKTKSAAVIEAKRAIMEITHV